MPEGIQGAVQTYQGVVQLGYEQFSFFINTVDKEVVEISDADVAGLRDVSSGREVDI